MASTTARDVYTHGHHKAVIGSHSQRTAQNSAAYLLPHIISGDRILDVGCGPGSISYSFAKLPQKPSVLAIDYSEKIVDIAMTSYKDAVEKEKLELKFEVGSVYELEKTFGENQFDVVHAHQVLQHLSDPIEAIRQMLKVSKRIVAFRDVDYVTMCYFPYYKGLDRWKEIYLETCHRNKAFPRAGTQLIDFCRKAGVNMEKVNFSMHPVVYKSCFGKDVESEIENKKKKDWGNSWAERCLNSDFGKQAVQYGITTTAEMESIAQEFRKWAEDETAVFCYMNGEIIINK